MDDLSKMSPSTLLENFRSLSRGMGSSSNPAEKERLGKKADQYEEEILKRMAW